MRSAAVASAKAALCSLAGYMARSRRSAEIHVGLVIIDGAATLDPRIQ